MFILLFIGCRYTNDKVQVLPNAHAHNDYEHERPLFDALENGFISVEADVFMIENNLWVAHERPDTLNATKTLEALYLQPLRQRIQENNGSIYSGYDEFFYLMVDVKTPAKESYPLLREILSKYDDIISVIHDSTDQDKPVKVFITGFHGRPFKQILNDSIKYAGIDGRPNELERGISSEVMPIISQNYNKYLSWNGQEGNPDPEELYKLTQMIDKAHREGKMVRLWATPDNELVWTFLLDIGIDLINTDDLSGLNGFLTNRYKQAIKP
ncbi:MAG: phosphatidylinositol-specific phospholipase C/glycerophosphodiester phosphodiesterase family protein [Cyclobacteriaceae bacterium]